MKPVYSYIDYRLFLRDYYAEKKGSNRHYSYRVFALKSGINSPSFLKEVIEGKRNLSEAAMEKFCAAIGFDQKATRYFQHLVLFNQAKNAALKQEHYAVLRDMHGRVDEKVLSGAYYDLFSNWYTVVMRELVCIYNFGDDYQAIAAAVAPPITAAQARKSVELLLSMGLIKRTENGGYVQTNAALVADESVRSLAVRAFTHTMLNHAGTALDELPKERRHISGITMGISGATYDVIAAETEAFKDRIKSIVAQDSQSDRVYHLNMQLFPASATLARANDEGGPHGNPQ